jgi:hypothetical protein
MLRSNRHGLLLLIGLAASTPLYAQQPAACTPSREPEPAALLRESLRALGAEQVGDAVVHARASEAIVENYQSDRAYPPFFLGIASREWWYRPFSGALRSRGRMAFPDGEYDLGDILSGARATYLAGDSLRPAPSAHGGALATRALDPWPVLYDWSTGGQISLLGRCRIRDYPRIVLQRAGPYGPERLALDSRTRLPVSLEREEPHYLWGQVSVAYVYSNWSLEAGLWFPGSSFRVVDGDAEMSRTTSAFTAMPADSAPTLALPDSAGPMTPSNPAFLRPTPPDSVRVGAATRLLTNPGYTEGIVLLGDTLYLLDATQGEERARADSAMIARIFPGTHPIVLVVTDVAWPHVAGLRYWVARGATVVSHPASRPFIERVLQRRWTRRPDLYERQRGKARLVFRPVRDSLALAGGRLRIYPIDGISSEGGLMAYVEGDRFLWAGDYVQTVEQPSTYAAEVWQAVRRAGLRPAHVAAQHLPLTNWATVDSLVGSDRRREES